MSIRFDSRNLQKNFGTPELSGIGTGLTGAPYTSNYLLGHPVKKNYL